MSRGINRGTAPDDPSPRRARDGCGAGLGRSSTFASLTEKETMNNRETEESRIIAASPVVHESGMLPYRIVIRDLGDQHVDDIGLPIPDGKNQLTSERSLVRYSTSQAITRVTAASYLSA
jgi:hypothetical protein